MATRAPFKMSDLQRKMFFGMAQRAATHLGELCQDYRKNAMHEELGITSSMQIKSPAEYDAMIRRFAVDAGDWAFAADTGLSDIKRFVYLIKVCAIQLMQLKGGDEVAAAHYLEGVVKQAGFMGGWLGNGFFLDIPARQLRTVFNILDSERRRLHRRYLVEGELALDYKSRYEALPSGYFIKKPVERGYYAAKPFNININTRD